MSADMRIHNWKKLSINLHIAQFMLTTGIICGYDKFSFVTRLIAFYLFLHGVAALMLYQARTRT